MTYTRDEIMTMTAEELRVEIAKKKGIENINCDREGDWFGISVRGNHATAFFRDWITDIAAAWELVEEMARNGMLVTFQISRNVVSILVNTPIFDGSETIRVNDNSASTTISRAWLIWSEEMGK